MFEDILRAAQKANGAPIEEKTPPKLYRRNMTRLKNAMKKLG